MRISKPLPYVCLLALVVVSLGSPARSDAKPSRCSVVAKGWKGEVAGRKIRPTHAAVEHRVIKLVNSYRRKHGLRPLKLDPGLRYAARARGVVDKKLTARLALYTPSGCIAEKVVRKDGLSGAASIMRTLRKESESRHVLLLPWTRRIGVGVRVGTFKGERVTIATAEFSAAHPRSATSKSANAKSKPKKSKSASKNAKPKAAKPKKGTPAVISAPVTPTVPATPVSVPATPTPSGPVVGVPYTCNGPVNGVRVVGTGSDSRALVILGPGCTGTLSFDIHVTSGGGDGVKVQGGVHDLTIGPSRIVCDRLTDTSFHQDGVQVQGGTNVTFNGLSIVCPYVTGQGAAGFYIDGKDFGGISNVVCDGCNLEHLHYGAMFTGPAPGSGVRNSVIHQGAMTGGYFALLGDLSGALNLNNTLAPPCDGAGVPC